MVSYLCVTKPVLVRDVVGDASLATRFSTSTTRLEVKLLTPLLQSRQTLLGPPWQIHVNRGSHPSAQVGGAGVEISVLGVQHEVLARLSLDRVLDSLDATSQSLKHSLDITPLLHGDDTQLVLLVHPDLG